MRNLLIALWMLFFSATAAIAEVSIGINISLFPDLVRVPGYPVYYAPRLGVNFFFYDGLYWVFEGDNWYASSWYNGPWQPVFPEYVPLFVLRIPVRYYVSPPVYFRRWQSDGPPRWGEHWGRDWEQRRSGWDRWERNAVPEPAPLPTYQRSYSGNRYPTVEQQKALHSENYRYQPREAAVRQIEQQPAAQRAPAPQQRERQAAPEEQRARPQDSPRSSEPAPRQSAPAARSERPPKGEEDAPRSMPGPALEPRPRGPAAEDRMLRPPEPAPRERQQPNFRQEEAQPGPGPSPEPRRGQGQEKERDRGQDRGPERGQGRDR